MIHLGREGGPGTRLDARAVDQDRILLPDCDRNYIEVGADDMAGVAAAAAVGFVCSSSVGLGRDVPPVALILMDDTGLEVEIKNHEDVDCEIRTLAVDADYHSH